MLSMPARTQFDLNFRLFGIPIQVSPWFWLVAAMLGYGISDERPQILLIWVACVFISILIHELGHGLTGRLFGYHPRIALYWMGGLCASNEPERTPRQRLAVLLMGPGAQILLVGLVFAVGWLVWGIGWRGDRVLVTKFLGLPDWFAGGPEGLEAGATEIRRAVTRGMGDTGFFAYGIMIFINLLWAFLNLLPIYPLDGGQIAQIFLIAANRVHGARRTHIVSMITAGAIAAYLASKMGNGDTGSLINVIFFGSFALLNYQALQAHHDHYMANGPDDADWWKR